MKKIKKKVRKQRAVELKVDFGKANQVITGMNQGDDGTFTFYGEHGEVIHPVRIEVGSAYIRGNKKPKTLTRVPCNPESIQTDPNRLLAKFDFLFAVDTNTKQIGAVKVSVSAAHHIWDIRVTKDRWDVKCTPQNPFEFHDSSDLPEKVGWWEIIQRIQVHGFKGEVGLIVDSDMDQLTEINARSRPLVGNFHLPDGIELIYGCGDRGTQEYITNAAISHCDRVSRSYIHRVEQEQCSGQYFPIKAQEIMYARYRYHVLLKSRT
jgi:hypothetical protein